MCSLNLQRAKKVIEKRRVEINELYENNIFTDDNTLKKSWKLDVLLNKYDRALKRQNEHI